jgi:hypothetical protein
VDLARQVHGESSRRSPAVDRVGDSPAGRRPFASSCAVRRRIKGLGEIALRIA